MLVGACNRRKACAKDSQRCSRSDDGNGFALTRRRVLVAEDNLFIALNLTRLLRTHGLEIVGPVATVKEALAVISAHKRIDAAALDVNLRGETAYRVADALRAKNVPTIFMTGYDDRAIDPGYTNVPYLVKPVAVERLIQAIFRR